jgi:pyruvate dehydrogenase kinase 2/3/4
MCVCGVQRIGLRLLIGHYLALHEKPTEDYVGVVCMRSKVREIVQTAAEDARWICREKYGAAPEIMIIGGEKLTFCHVRARPLSFSQGPATPAALTPWPSSPYPTNPQVPAHLHYMVMELLKNALQAVCQKHGARDDAPPVTVMLERDYSLTDGQQVVIRIEDRGGGIPSEDFENIWCYLYTTADPGVQAAMIGAQRSRGQRGLPLAGLGYGLPLSRLYAQHFGGNLELHNTPGEGLEAELRLNRLGDKKEPLV